MARILKHPPRKAGTYFLASFSPCSQYQLWRRVRGVVDELIIDDAGDEPRTVHSGTFEEQTFVRLTPEQAQAGIACAQMGQWDRWARSLFDA